MVKLFLLAAFVGCFVATAEAATLSAKTAAGTSSVAGAANTITIGFTCDTPLASGDTVTISGLTNLGDPNSNAIVLTGTDKALFTANSVAERGDWTLSTGTIVLTANQAVSATAKTVSFAMTNKATAVSAVTPQIAINYCGHKQHRCCSYDGQYQPRKYLTCALGEDCGRYQLRRRRSQYYYDWFHLRYSPGERGHRDDQWSDQSWGS